MENLYIPPTNTSPEVDFRFDRNVLTLKGESYPENAAAFYGPILQQLQTCLDANKAPLSLHVALIYFNSSSTKMLFTMFDMLNQSAEEGQVIDLHWHYDADDDMILEFGQELQGDFPALNFHEHPVNAAEERTG